MWASLVPEPCGGAVAHGGHEARQGRHARQEHLALDQPGRGQVEEDAGALGTGPGPRVEPADQPEVLGLVGEVAIAIVLADRARVLPPGRRPRTVARQAGRVGDGELRGHMGDHTGRHVRRVGQERPEEAHRRELEGAPQPVVLAAPCGQQQLIGVVEMEVACELGGCRFADVAAVPLGLFVGQQGDRHRRPPPTMRPLPTAARIRASISAK